MNTPLRVPPAALACMLLTLGCRAKPAATGRSIPTASPTSVALPGSNDAADAANAPEVAQSASGSFTAYSDPATGVSFRYPSPWRPWHTGSPMHPAALAQSGSPVKITQVFDPGGTEYGVTNLLGVSFSYAVRPQGTAGACAHLPQTLLPGGRDLPAEAINSVSFTRYEAEDAGMCHQRSAIFNSTLRGGTCYLFERDLETVCPDIRGPRKPVALSAGQIKLLQHELDRVMQSVELR